MTLLPRTSVPPTRLILYGASTRMSNDNTNAEAANKFKPHKIVVKIRKRPCSLCADHTIHVCASRGTEWRWPKKSASEESREVSQRLSQRMPCRFSSGIRQVSLRTIGRGLIEGNPLSLHHKSGFRMKHAFPFSTCASCHGASQPEHGLTSH